MCYFLSKFSESLGERRVCVVSALICLQVLWQRPFCLTSMINVLSKSLSLVSTDNWNLGASLGLPTGARAKARRRRLECVARSSIWDAVVSGGLFIYMPETNGTSKSGKSRRAETTPDTFTPRFYYFSLYSLQGWI